MKLYLLALALPLLTACMILENINDLLPELIYQPLMTGATATLQPNEDSKEFRL